MGMEPENSAARELVPGCGEQTGCKLVQVTRHPQRIRRRLAATDLFADVFLQIDDDASFVHNRNLAPFPASGEQLVCASAAHATSAFSLRQTSSTLARELKAEMRK